MLQSDAPAIENQLDSESMKDREALRVDAAPIDPLNTAEPFGGFLPLALIVAAAAALVFGLLASNTGEPLLLTVIAVLAMLGMFLIFGVAAGHIRIGSRLAASDLLKAAADASDEPQIIAQLDSTVVYANPALDNMFGSNDAGPFGTLEAVMSGEPEATQALFRLMRAAERGEKRVEDVRLRPGAGQGPSWIRISVRPFASSGHDFNGAIARQRLVQWRIKDVSDAKTAEAQRIGSLQSALAAFDTMPAGFMSIAGDGTILHVNAAFEQWLGYPVGSLRTHQLRLAELAGADGAQLLARMADIPEADQRVVDLDLTRQDGRMVPLTLLVEPSGEQPEQGFTITAINRLTAGLGDRSHQDVRASQFFQSAPFGIATIDGEGRIANCNAAFMRLLLDGRPAQDVLASEALGRTGGAEERARIEAGLAEVLAGRGNVQPVEITSGDQKQQTCRVFMSPLAAVSGGAAAALYVIDAT